MYLAEEKKQLQATEDVRLYASGNHLAADGNYA